MMEDVVIEIDGYEVIISACDYNRVMEHKWYRTGRKDKSPYFRHN
jgi:hypothetical protein